MKFVAVDADNGDARLIHNAKDDSEARKIMVKHLLDEEVVDNEEDAINLVNDGFDFYQVSEEVGK